MELFPELENMYGTDVGFEFENNQFSFTAKPHVDHDMEACKGNKYFKLY